MMLKPFFTYYGGKYRIAPSYPKPLYATIVEPFAGSAGYALRYPNRKIILNDKDPIIAGLWEYLIRVSEKEIMSLPLNVSSVEEISCKESQWLVGFWFNKGSNSPRKTPSSWCRSGTRPNSYWGEVIRHRIASQLQYIRHWKISHDDYRMIENERATWFVDPPYCSKAGKIYRQKFTEYKDLAQWCNGRIGQVIVCESDGADWLPFKPFRLAKANQSKYGGKYIKEVVYYREDFK